MFQLFVLSTIEIIFYSLNRAILFGVFKTEDLGGSMTIHIFGAYFGIAATFFYQAKAACKDKKKLEDGNYLSDLVSMSGTLFLFVYWPSFNAA
jgi:ammonium transporter Rh